MPDAMTISIFALVIAFLSHFVHFGQLKLASDELKQAADLNRKSAELLALLELQKLSTQVELARGIEIISKVQATNWDEFKNVASQDQQAIRMTVGHLNFVATLIFSDHLNLQTGWNTYFQPYRLAGKKLLPWWFDGASEEFPNRYISARRMMNYVLAITDEEVSDFDRKRASQLDERFAALRRKK